MYVIPGSTQAYNPGATFETFFIPLHFRLGEIVGEAACAG